MGDKNNDKRASRITVVGGGKLNEEDRLELAKLLIKAGYAVVMGKDKMPGKNTVYYYVQYWEED